MTDTPAQDLRSALEPCPLCQSQASLVFGGEVGRFDQYDVDCTGCGLYFHGPAIAEGEAAKAATAAAWNRRAALAQPAEKQSVSDHMIDMANVGEALMEAIRDYSSHTFMKHWHPADCPTEIVGDLLNALDEAAQPAENAKAGEVDPIGQVRVEANGEWILKGWATNLPEGVHWLYAHPPAAEPVGLREAVEAIANGVAPREGYARVDLSAVECRRLARKALATPARTDDAGQPSGDVAAMREALGFDTGQDASLNLQGALDDLQGRHKINDGGVVERTLQRVIGQIERVRALPTGKQSLQVEEKAAGVGEDVARIIAKGYHGDPWWWHQAFDDGQDETAATLRADDMEVSASVLAALSPAAHADVRDGETIESIIAWGDEIFGPCEPARAVSRAMEEWREMEGEEAGTMAHAIEAADVIIVLLRLPLIREAINAKMATNRKRIWNLKGDGTGYHVSTPPAALDEGEG